MLGIEIWTWSADHHTGPWLKNATRKGLTEGSTRSHTYKVRNFLHYGRQPQKAPHLFWVFRTSQYCNDHGIAPDAATVFRRAVSDAVDAAWMQLGWIGSSR